MAAAVAANHGESAARSTSDLSDSMSDVARRICCGPEFCGKAL
jgi:hypothetical protein